jgi:hypothetical protein
MIVLTLALLRHSIKGQTKIFIQFMTFFGASSTDHLSPRYGY